MKTDYLLELGDDFYDTLPDYDGPDAWEHTFNPGASAFVNAEVESFRSSLESEVHRVYGDWLEQRGESRPEPDDGP